MNDYWLPASFSSQDALAVINAFYGVGNGSIYLDEVMCLGVEGSLLSCFSAPIGVHNCTHNEDAGVNCPSESFAFFIAITN